MRPIEAKDPKDLIRMLMALGDAYLEKGLYSDAAKKYEQIIALKVANKNLYINLSKAYIGLNKLDHTAIVVFKKAIQYAPHNADLCKILAISFLNEGRDDPEALQIYQVALRHDTPIFDKLAERVGMIYFKKKDFHKCKETVELILVKSGYQPRAFSMFIHSCWSAGLLNDAIARLKTLIDVAENKNVLGKYLCVTFLEKKFAAELESQIAIFSLLDKNIILSFLGSITRFNRLQDLSLFLELKRFLTQDEYWGDSRATSAKEPENAYVLQQIEGYAEASEERQESAALPSSNITADVLNKLQPFEAITGRSIGTGTHSELTYEDFQKEGAAIFSETKGGSQKWKLPDNLEVLITIEFSNYDQLRTDFGQQRIEQIKRKLYVLLFDQLEKYRLVHIWVASNGLLIFAKETLSAVSFATGVLSKLGRFNHLSEPNEQIHLSIGIHCARENFGQDSDQTLKDLSIGVKIGIASERDLPAESEYSDILRKTDRIFLTAKAYRQVRNSNRFVAEMIGQVKLKYFGNSLGLHETDWRNPIDELTFGNINKLGRFELLNDLGKKGVFQAYKAKDSILRRIVLLKVIKSEVFSSLPASNEQKRAFYQMAKALGQMSHPNIANIYEVEEDKGLTYIVREFIEGAPVTEIFQSQIQFNAQRFVQIILQICKGLHYAHQLGFFHLNLKPGNIRVGLYDETKLMDFFNPQAFFGDKKLPQSDEDNDRVYYLSPEQIQGQDGDSRSDIFSLGAILYQVVTGMNPFADSTEVETGSAILSKVLQPPRELNDQLPKFCEVLIMKCLAKEPMKRFQTVNEMITVIKTAIENGIVANFNYHIAQSRDH